jgi:diphosphoinositol-polyphosphate diphosphatase
MSDEIAMRYPPSSDWQLSVLKKATLVAEEDGEVVEDFFAEHLLKLTAGVHSEPCGEAGGVISPWFHKTFTYAGTDDRHVTLRVNASISAGATGCAIWEAGVILASLFVSLQASCIFDGRMCLELGSGAGLAAVCMSRAALAKLILSDGNPDSLDNLRYNLQLNGVTAECVAFDWEQATKEEIESLASKVDLVVAADVLYDPCTIPWFIPALLILLSPQKDGTSHKRKEAWVATALRQESSLLKFLQEAANAGLEVSDETARVVQLKQTFHLFDPLRSQCDRVLLHRIRSARTGRDLQRRNDDGGRLIAGCIPTRGVGATLQIMVIMARGTDAQVTFPKGGWEEDETLEQAAQREACEEAGVRGALRQLIGSYSFASKQGRADSASVFWLEVNEVLEHFPEENQRSREWVSPAQALARLKHDWCRQALSDWARLADIDLAHSQ